MLFRKKRLKRKQKKTIIMFIEFYQKSIELLDDESKIEYNTEHSAVQKAKLEGACEILELTVQYINGWNINILDKNKNTLIYL